MAHLPLTQDERALCFVPAAKQFERARELRAKLRSPSLAGSCPVLIEADKPKDGCADNYKGPLLYDFVWRLTAATQELGYPVISFGFDPLIKVLMRSIEHWFRLSPDALICGRQTADIVEGRHVFFQTLADCSALKRRTLGDLLKTDHTMATYYILKPRVVISRTRPPVKIKGSDVLGDRRPTTLFTAKEERLIIQMAIEGASTRQIVDAINETAHPSRHRNVKVISTKLIRLASRGHIPVRESKRFTPEEDATIIRLAKAKATIHEICKALGNRHNYDPVRKRIYKLRDRGQL